MFYVDNEGCEDYTEILDLSDGENDVVIKNVRKENGVTFEGWWG